MQNTNQNTNYCPALLVTAPASGQGKTTVVAALARLHARRGAKVRVFKCGPDFLDPFWHQLASAAPVYQLDLWINGEADCRARLAAAAREADLILVEGVMGLFDGTPSAADLAERLGLPVLAVINAAAMAGTFGALAWGLQHHRPGLPWAGVLANRVAGDRHAQMLQQSLREPDQWLGALPRNSALTIPERHLGLTPTDDLDDALVRLDAAADALQATPLGQMTLAQCKRWRVPFTAPAAADLLPTPPLLQGQTIAVALDAAFCFVYAANLDCLRALGAELVLFSPLAASALPACDAVWLPGGYPELHAQRLSANTALRDSLRLHAAAGKPVWAECGGMMLLWDTLVDADGTCWPMWGLLPGTVTMNPRLTALGPQQLMLDGAVLRGHTFHFSSTQTPLTPLTRTAAPGGQPSPEAGEALWQSGSVRASYFHAWFASNPAAAAALFCKARSGTDPAAPTPALSTGSIVAGPRRIVCLTEETTEWLYLLGQEQRIVGISGYTVRPKRARAEKPRVSAFTSARIEQILALQPDCVLGFSDMQADIAAALIRAGVQVLVFNQRSVAEINSVLWQVAALLGQAERGAAMLLKWERQAQQIQRLMAGFAIRPKVYFEEWNEPPISAIRWVSELIAVAGGQDIFPELAAQPLGRNRIVADPLEVVRRNPDIIIGSWCGKKFRPEQVVARPGWADVAAVRNAQVFEIKSADILQPGPAALTDGLARLHQIMQDWQQRFGDTPAPTPYRQMTDD